jgi:hypothetical protein
MCSNTIICNATKTLQLHLWQHLRCVAIVHFATRTSVAKKPNCNVALRCNKNTFTTTWWTTSEYPNATRPFASHGPRNNLVAIVSIGAKYGILQHILCVALGENPVVARCSTTPCAWAAFRLASAPPDDGCIYKTIWTSSLGLTLSVCTTSTGRPYPHAYLNVCPSDYSWVIGACVTPDFPKKTKCIPICMPGSNFMHIVT